MAISHFLDQLNLLVIETDERAARLALTNTVALARSERLTTYDASYLELAMRKGLPLASKDKALRQAAARNGVELLPAE